MAFTAGRRPQEDGELSPLWFIVDRGRVLIRPGKGGPSFPDSSDLCCLDLDASSGLPDPTEILEARWFTRDTLPEIPASIRIARRLIDAFMG